jgi:hypothetical protein
VCDFVAGGKYVVTQWLKEERVATTDSRGNVFECKLTIVTQEYQLQCYGISSGIIRILKITT